jgi:integral membrane protein
MTSHPALIWFAKIAFWEGISFLVLLGIAMPFKYFLGYPQAVQVVGWLHGVLFMLYAIALLWVFAAVRWPIWKCALAMLAAFLPFGPFWFDRRYLSTPH